MRPRAQTVALAMLLALPLATPASAQLGVGAHVGTTGFGGDVALALGGSAQVRGTLGIMPIEPSLEISGFDATVELPKTWASIGVDFFPTGSGFRIGAGLLFKPDDPTASADCTGTIEVGDETYNCSDVGTATAEIDMKGQAPYVMIGFGKIASSGIGLFLDLGAAFVGESTLDLDVDGPIRSQAQFQTELAREEQEWEDKINDYKIFPMVSLGLRVGIGN